MGKILRIDRTLGIEGKFVSPNDPETTIRLFNEQYDGTESVEELMNLERQRIAEAEPDLWMQLPELPLRLFSGKRANDEPPAFHNREGELIPLERTGVTGISVVIRCQTMRFTGIFIRPQPAKYMIMWSKSGLKSDVM